MKGVAGDARAAYACWKLSRLPGIMTSRGRSFYMEKSHSRSPLLPFLFMNDLIVK